MQFLFSPAALTSLLATRAHFFFSPQMEVDGPLSAQEQMIILYNIKLQCQQNLSNTDTQVTGKNQKEKKKKLCRAAKPQQRIHQH